MDERRQHQRRQRPRTPVTWIARVWLRDDWFTIARAINASMHGLGLAISQHVPAWALRPGGRYRLEVRTERKGELVFVGTLRRVGRHGAGFEIEEIIPLGSSPPAGRDANASERG